MYHITEIRTKENIYNLRIASSLARKQSVFMRKLKDLLENIHKWPAKRKNHGYFFHTNFLLYSTILAASFLVFQYPILAHFIINPISSHSP